MADTNPEKPMPHAIRVHEIGGPEVLRWEEVPMPAARPGEVLVRQEAVGLNFIDTYLRAGVYPAPSLPFTPGFEAAGVVERVGSGVTGVAAGDRVAYVMEPGAYAEYRAIDASRVVKLPAEVDARTAAAVLLKGLTAEYLLRRTYPVKAGETILVHAAAGGVGLLMCQWADHLGTQVIGTAGGPEKVRLAAANGCHHPVDYTREDFVARAREITGGAGVPVVYDSVGADTFERSLRCLAPRGLLVSFGQTSGRVPPFDILTLSTHDSLYLTRPTLAGYIADPAELGEAAATLFGLIGAGHLRATVGATYPLREAARAHEALEARRTVGSTVLVVEGE